MKLFWATLSLFCITSTVVAHEALTADEYLDQYLEENPEYFSLEYLDLTYSGDWMWFGAFPWVYSSKYESWLYLYANLDVSIYGENGYARKDSNYCTKMNWVWVVREDHFGLEYQSKFAYSNDEKAWLHFKQRDEEELYCYSATTRVWKNFGSEMFNWLDRFKIDLDDLIDDLNKQTKKVELDDPFGRNIVGVEIEPANAYKPGDVITQDTEIQMMRETIIQLGACPSCPPRPEGLIDSSYYCSCRIEGIGFEFYYRPPTTSEIENQQIEGFYYVGKVMYLGSSPYLEERVNQEVLNKKAIDIDLIPNLPSTGG